MGGVDDLTWLQPIRRRVEVGHDQLGLHRTVATSIHRPDIWGAACS